MQMLFRAIRAKAFHAIDSLMRQYVVEKYGPGTMLCSVTGDGKRGHGKLYAHMGIGEPSEWDAEYDACYPIRKLCGETMLMQRGLPKPDGDPPIVVLMPTPSMWRALGIKAFDQFISDWPGDSKVGDIVAVKYTVL